MAIITWSGIGTHLTISQVFFILFLKTLHIIQLISISVGPVPAAGCWAFPSIQNICKEGYLPILQNTKLPTCGDNIRPALKQMQVVCLHSIMCGWAFDMNHSERSALPKGRRNRGDDEEK